MLIAQELNGLFSDTTVIAMGDRAGSFACIFEGNVIQSEGLAGDISLVDAIQAGLLEEQLNVMESDYILSWTGPQGVDDYDCWEIVISDRAQCRVFNNVIRVNRESEVMRWKGTNESVFLWSFREY